MTAAAAVKSPIWTHGKADAIINAFSVRVPIIVNTVALKADDELILKWKWPANNKKKPAEQGEGEEETDLRLCHGRGVELSLRRGRGGGD